MKLRTKKTLMTTKLHDAVVILNLSNGQYYELGGCALGLWKFLENGATPESLEKHLLTEFSAPLNQVKEDVSHFIAELKTADLLEISA